MPSAMTLCKAKTARLTSLASFRASSSGISASVSSVSKVVSMSSGEMRGSEGEGERLVGDGKWVVFDFLAALCTAVGLETAADGCCCCCLLRFCALLPMALGEALMELWKRLMIVRGWNNSDRGVEKNTGRSPGPSQRSSPTTAIYNQHWSSHPCCLTYCSSCCGSVGGCALRKPATSLAGWHLDLGSSPFGDVTREAAHPRPFPPPL